MYNIAGLMYFVIMVQSRATLSVTMCKQHFVLSNSDTPFIMSGEIPLIDFQSCGLHVERCNISGADLKSVGAQVVQALSTIGFCYLKNHGVPDKMVQDCRASSLEFFQQPVSFKQQYRRLREPHNYTGWVGMEDESTNPKRPGDLKEAFNYSRNGNLNGWPDGFLENYRHDIDQFFHTASNLALRILEVVASGLGLEKDNDLLRSHTLIGKPGNHTEMRTLYYPPISSAAEIKEDQVRLGEHFDFGSLTVLFQDSAGGLEVCRADGQYVPAVPIEGTCLLNIGEVLQRWTADRLLATKHRVMIPQDHTRLKIPRQSLVLFLCPDDDFMIRVLDGSDKYPPTPFLKHAIEMMEQTYAGKYV